MGKNGKRIILMVVFGLIVTLSVIAVTYAYYIGSTNNDKAQTANLSTGTMSLTFADNDNGFGGAIEFGQTITKKFTIQNTGTLDAYASIEWFNLTNLYLYGSLVYDLEYSENLNRTYTKIVDEARVPTTDNNPTTEMLAAKITVPASKTYYYNLKVTLKDLTDLDQTTDLSAHFFTQFQMKGLNERISDSYETLANLGLSVRSNEPDFKKILTNIADYREIQFNSEVKSTDMTSKQNLNVSYSDAYTINKYSGNLTLTNPSSGKYSEIYSQLPGKLIDCSILGLSLSQWSLCKVTNKTDANTIYYNVSERHYDDYSDTGIYPMEDDYGTSYYFRGAVTNNYVKFGKYKNVWYKRVTSKGLDSYIYPTIENCQKGISSSQTCESLANEDMWWRIIRINGDGSVRLIYNGLKAESDLVNSQHIGTRSFNSYTNDDGIQYNAQVGYMYGPGGFESYEANHSNVNSSTIKTYIDTWYEDNLYNSEFEQYISDEIFCNDRSVFSGDGYSNDGTEYTGSNRWITHSPSLKCPQKNDAFTTNDIIHGNGDLTYPVALITSDEVMIAGASEWYQISLNHMNDMVNNSKLFYLHEGLTMTPDYYLEEATMKKMYYDGGQISSLTSNKIYPVINLSKEAASILIGNGTKENPYRLPE